MHSPNISIKLSAVLNLFISKDNKDLLLGTGAENCNRLC